jgi:hypothetical protein
MLAAQSIIRPANNRMNPDPALRVSGAGFSANDGFHLGVACSASAAPGG